MATTEAAWRHEKLGRGEVLVGPDWLEEHLHDPDLRVVEVDASATAYDEGHIEGAVLWNVYRDLKDSEYRLIDTAATERLFARSGITPGSVVVVYGYAPAMGFWLLKLYGHTDVRILDCARSGWHDGGRPWTKDVERPVPTRYPLPEPDDRIRAVQPVVEDAIGSPTSMIVDVRSGPEYRGERFWPSGGLEEGGRTGHIPSAVHLPIEEVHDQTGSFLSPAELRQLFAPIDPEGDAEIIPYCTIGGRASTAWFVLSYLLGRRHVRVYDGSWAEWGRMPATPVACA
jgi:thiosulfate/3-mercaptopyruvate sulfurtransferase